MLPAGGNIQRAREVAKEEGAPIAFECTVEHIFSAPDGLNNIVWGNVVRFYIRDDLYVGGRMDFGAIAPDPISIPVTPAP